MVDELSAEEIGRRRQDLHQGHSTPRLFDDPYEEDIIGCKGEIAFGKFVNLPPDLMDRISGDSGDFVVPLNFVFDVKTARIPAYLLVKVTEIDKPVDIDLLAQLHKDDTITFIGWQWRSVMKQQPTKDFGVGVPSHYMIASELRSMELIKSRLTKNEGRDEKTNI